MDKYVVLDCDETILYSRSCVPGSILFLYEDDDMSSFTIARPSAKAFLEALQAKGYRVIMMTQGYAAFQRTALKLVGLDHYFEAIYGYVTPIEVTPMPALEKYVLVDNCHYREWTVAEKRKWLGKLDETNSVKCVPFHGLEANEDSLLTLLPEIYRLLA